MNKKQLEELNEALEKEIERLNTFIEMAIESSKTGYVSIEYLQLGLTKKVRR